MKKNILFATIILLATNIVAQELNCEELWIKRNAIFAKHGYCFKNKEGIKVFGKKCKRGSIKLTLKEKKEVARLRKLEDKLHCNYKEIAIKEAYYKTVKDTHTKWKPSDNAKDNFYLHKGTKNLKVIAKDDTNSWYKITYNVGVGKDMVGWIKKSKLLKQEKIDKKTQNITKLKEKALKSLLNYHYKKDKYSFDLFKRLLNSFLHKSPNEYDSYSIYYKCNKKENILNCEISSGNTVGFITDLKTVDYQFEETGVTIIFKAKVLKDGSVKIKSIEKIIVAG